MTIVDMFIPRATFTTRKAELRERENTEINNKKGILYIWSVGRNAKTSNENTTDIVIYKKRPHQIQRVRCIYWITFTRNIGKSKKLKVFRSNQTNSSIFHDISLYKLFQVHKWKDFKAMNSWIQNKC